MCRAARCSEIRRRPLWAQKKKETSKEVPFSFSEIGRRFSALLEHGGNALAAADAEGGKTLLGVVALEHFVQQGDDDTSAGSADGVADGDGAAVDVDLAHVEVQLTRDGDGLRGEGFVGLDEVDIVVDCVDNIETRLLIEEECEKRKKVLIHGAVDGIMGQCMICYPGERRLSKMYRKSKDVPHKTYSFVVALVASIQVALVYSVLKHEDEDTKGKLFMLDLGVMETRVVKL